MIPMIDQFLGKGCRPSCKPCQPPPHPTVSAFNALGVFLTNQVLEVRQQSGKLFPAIGGIKVNPDAFQAFGQITNACLVAFAHRNGQDFLQSATISIQNPDPAPFGANKRPHFINLHLEIPLAARLDLHQLTPADDPAKPDRCHGWHCHAETCVGSAPAPADYRHCGNTGPETVSRSFCTGNFAPRWPSCRSWLPLPTGSEGI